jgi:hypothetical protein
MDDRSSKTPTEAGRRWAEERAESLADNIPAVDWPDLWPRAWDGKLELPDEVAERDALAYRAAAHHAAAERWVELLTDRRETEDAPEEEADAEAEAIRLVSLIRGDLPAGMTAGHDGPRAYLRDDRGMEMTIHSLEDAWRVISEYDERYTG